MRLTCLLKTGISSSRRIVCLPDLPCPKIALCSLIVAVLETNIRFAFKSFLATKEIVLEQASSLAVFSKLMPYAEYVASFLSSSTARYIADMPVSPPVELFASPGVERMGSVALEAGV